ncbi:mitochondrial import inner membrane translocase subunit TIM50-like [Chenopodium quinoa]|uniref:Mitochondrial import inner membrane translocase subunit TIM50 n=1 Tax=Chenopodium quinoa TaxID=63459 RepID=A0A803MGJ7_CHEQI|nr:mitochondrial import inner membrane translocase subunit TIM50-like [Chenopodium quinoa]
MATLLRSVRRSSLLTLINNSKRSTSSSSISTPFARYCSSSSTFSASSDPILSHNSTPPKSRFLSLLKFSVAAAVVGAFSTAGYATYAYTADEVDEKTKAFRSSINHPMIDSSITIETLPHLVYSAVMTVPSKAVDLYLDLRCLTEGHIQEIAEPNYEKLLPDLVKEHEQLRIFTLVLDLSETLILHDWKREIGWSTFKRPGLDAFLKHMSEIYEIVVYSDKVLEDNIYAKLMEKGVHHVLGRAATKYQDGKHFRDLSKLNRDPSRVIYVSAHALETCLQPENCVSIKPWKKEADDTTLIDLIPFLEYVGVQKPADIRSVLASYQGKDVASEFINRSREYQRQIGKKQNAFCWSRHS